MNIWFLCLTVLFNIPIACQTASLLPVVSRPLFISKSEAKQQELEVLKKSLEEYKKNLAQDEHETEAQLNIIKQEMAAIKESLRTDPENDFLLKKMALINDRYQLLKDLNQAFERRIATMEEYVQFIEDYLKDPELKQYYQELGTVNRLSFSFEDLRQIKEKIESKKGTIEVEQQREASTAAEIKNREAALGALIQQYKLKEQEEGSEKQHTKSFDLEVKHHYELGQLEFALLATRKQVDELQLQILEFRLRKIRFKIEIDKLQLNILQDVLARIKQSSIRISEADIVLAKEELEKRRQELNALKIDLYEPKKEGIRKQIALKKESLESQSKQYNVPITDELDEWLFVPKLTIESHLALFAVAKANEALLVDQLELEELEAQITLQDQSLFYDRIANDIKSSFYKIYTGRFVSEEKIFEEIKRYEVKLSDIKADLSQLETKKTTLETQLTTSKKALENIIEKRQDILNQKDKLFKDHITDYVHILELLNISEDLVKKEIKVLNSIRGIYNDTVIKLIKIEQQIKFTIEELRASSRSIIWDRPEDAISWHGIRAIIPDIETFIWDVRSYVMHFEWHSFLYTMQSLFHDWYTFAYFILAVIGWLICLVLLRVMLPKFELIFITLKKDRKISSLAFAVQIVVSFITRYFFVIVLWFSVLLVLHVYTIQDPYPYIIFYLSSIPLLLFLAHRLIASFKVNNIEYDYVFLNKEYQRRFAICISTLVYASIAIFFFREAFILGNYPKSELPNILKALNIIILQISIIFLLTEELVLSLIPRTNDVCIWIRDKVGQYYYPILLIFIAIIVMMNPYVGFGRLVLFILSRVIYTLLLIGILFWVHGLVKQWSSALFFQSDQESVKERFSVAKTWYGIFIIATLFSFIFIGAIIVAKIWQWPEQLNNINEVRDIVEWLQTPILLQETPNPISIYTIVQFMLFVLCGFLVATAIRRFVLSRIFDILLVDSGVQNTVSSLMRYTIYLISIMLGLNAVGLGTQINYMLTALLVGIGIIIKDPAADFFAYFIILVQRPIKIGDYIKIDEEAMGVVRKITPRSIVLRRRNSTMIIVPNSYAVNHTIVNWNYIRGFIAFNDIKVVIAYKEDPSLVKELFERILDNSPYVLKNPKPVVRLDEFGVHGYEFMLRGFISSNYTLDQWDIASGIRLQVVKTLREHRIELALPIRLLVNYQDQKLQKQDYGTSEEPLIDHMKE